MSPQGQEFVELFLQEASELLQFLREYSGILQDPAPRPEDLERLYIAAHTLSGTSASYGYPLCSEIAGKMAHVFQYSMNASLAPEILGPLVEFLSDAITVLESDLLLISSSGGEVADEIEAFKQRYGFAFQSAPAAQPEPDTSTVGGTSAEQESGPEPGSFFERLPPDRDVPDEILEFFVPEAEEHLQTVTQCLLALETNPTGGDIHRLFRAIHTLKGSAAQVGLRRVEAVAHRVEDLIGWLRDGALPPSAETTDLCLQSVDILKKLLHRGWSSETEMRASVEPILERIAALAPGGPTPEEAQPRADLMEGGPGNFYGSSSASNTAAELAVMTGAALPGPGETASVAGGGMATSMPQPKSVRIALERLDRMMNAVGELVINRTRMVGRLAELEKLVDVLNFSKARLASKISEFQEKYEFSRLAGILPEASKPSPGGKFRRVSFGRSQPSSAVLVEFTELEMDRYDDFNILSRSLTEISADVTEVLTQLQSFIGRVETDIDEFTKLAHDLQDEITQARMVPIGNLYTRLSRTVRDAAKESGKQVELKLEGAETELDNNIIQQLSDPLIHLVRNAVAHGIEGADQRQQAGKPARGSVSVRAYHRGNHIFIQVEDDGGGIDYQKIRTSAVESGLISVVEADRLDERELRELLFRPGFSTAARKSELAGRGVGLDIVRTNLSALNGEIEIRTEKGAGTCFTLKVPLTLIISQALFVRCGSSVFALPLAVVEEIRRLRGDEIEEVGGKLLTKVRDVVTEVVRMDTQLGLEALEPVNNYYRMVIANVAGRQVGIVVEEVLRKDEIVIKNLGEYLRRVKLFPGTTIAPDGSLILLIDVNRLVSSDTFERRALQPSAGAARVFAPGAAAVAAGSIPAEAIDPVQTEKVVVVADDSISVRKFLGRFLEKAGYRVKLASDGLEASEIVAQSGCHLVVTDLEMPVMNGYELMATLRQNAATRNIPVLVVTSRAGAKHRDRAMKEGAASFLTKPVQEDQFLAVVAQMIGAGVSPYKPAAPVPVN